MSIFTPEELEGMRDCAWVLREIVRDLEKQIRPGLPTAEIDRVAAELVESYGVRSAFKGYRGYPACITASVNEEVIDGVPGERELQDGDVLKLQMGVESDGFYAYWANTYAIGTGTAPQALALLEAARRAMAAAVTRCTPGQPVEEISRVIEDTLRGAGFEVVRKYCGHGIGRRMHEDPQIPCYVDARVVGRYRLSEREVVALQVLALDRPARLTNRGGLTEVAPKGVHSVHIGTILTAANPPEVLLGPPLSR
ncbi:MAG: type I methionyl aminopeptidase [Planctomycetes bacterium]|nr:type I methionyl aminopeptidase [Planctomycetota bacterium]